MFLFFQAEDGIRDLVRSRGLGDVYKRQGRKHTLDRKEREAALALAWTAAIASDPTYARRVELMQRHLSLIHI